MIVRIFPCWGTWLSSWMSLVEIFLMGLFSAFATNVALASPTTGRPETSVLRTNHISCKNQADIEKLASFADNEELNASIIQHIISGRCAVVSRASKIVEMSAKKSANGNTYYCYRTVEYEIENSMPSEVIASNVECNIPKYITTLGELIAERTGEYSVTGSSPFSAVAVCNEGGRVQLRFKAGVVLRTAHVLPGAYQEDVLAESDVATAFRNGCKGADSIR